MTLTPLETWVFLGCVFLAAYLVVLVVGVLRTLRNDEQERSREDYWANTKPKVRL